MSESDDFKARQEDFVAGLRERYPILRDEALRPVLLDVAAGIQTDLTSFKKEVAVHALDQTVGLLAVMCQDSLNDLKTKGISKATKEILVTDPVRGLHVILTAAYEDILNAIVGFTDGVEGKKMTKPGKAIENDRVAKEEDDFVLTTKTIAQA